MAAAAMGIKVKLLNGKEEVPLFAGKTLVSVVLAKVKGGMERAQVFLTRGEGVGVKEFKLDRSALESTYVEPGDVITLTPEIVGG